MIYLTDNGLLKQTAQGWAFYSNSGQFRRFATDEDAKYLTSFLSYTNQIERLEFDDPVKWIPLFSVEHVDESKYKDSTGSTGGDYSFTTTTWFFVRNLGAKYVSDCRSRPQTRRLNDLLRNSKIEFLKVQWETTSASTAYTSSGSFVGANDWDLISPIDVQIEEGQDFRFLEMINRNDDGEYNRYCTLSRRGEKISVEDVKFAKNLLIDQEGQEIQQGLTMADVNSRLKLIASKLGV